MRATLLAVLFFLFVFTSSAQVVPIHPSDIVQGTYHGIGKPLRDIPPMSAEEFHQLELKGLKRTLNKDLKNRIFPFAETALPKGRDNFRQDFMGTNSDGETLLLNYDGQTSPYYPPDCNGTAGPNHFMQTINTVYAIYDKSGNIVAGPTNLNMLFGNVPGANRNDGDPIILYDEEADRWLVTEFSIPFSGPNYMLMAVSTTNDPTGTWHQYSFQVASTPDYPKFSIWQDGYYMGVNNMSGNDIYVFEREKMLIGAPAQAVGFNNPWRPSSVDGFMCVPPIDNDGDFAPAGSPGMFIAFNDDALGGGTDQLWLYDLDVDWTNTANSTFVRTQQIDVQPFNSNFGNNWDNIDQKGVSQRVDGIPQVIMNVPQYRNFGDQQTIVCCHTINMDGVRHAGIRWYELKKTTGNWEVRQHGTYAPDLHSRWMGSIVMNGSKEISLGYNISSTTVYPGIMYCGQSAAENIAASGVLDMTEDTIHWGAYSQTGANRWGDYSQICVDPTDDKTFWFTTQYIGSGGSRKTKIASWRYAFAPIASTLPASAITTSTATLNGTVNPNGQETTWHFEYGLSPSALTNSTPTVSAGTGNTSQNVSADISGLTAGTSYFYRLVAQNIGGVTNGLKVKFTTSLAPYMTVMPDHRNVSNAAGETDFAVSSNVDWTVSSDASWCTATLSGSGDDTIFVSFTENALAADRTARITVSGNGVASREVTVTQDGAAATLSVTPPTGIIASAGGEFEYSVFSNTTWTATSDQSWCTVTPEGSLDGKIIATCLENSSLQSRQSTITVTAPGMPPVSVVLLQEAAPIILAVSPLNHNVPAAAGTVNFDVISNTDWNVVSEASWCTVTSSGSGNGTIVVNYTQNTADQPRTANISVSASGFSGPSVTVTQAKSSIGIGENDQSGIQLTPNPNKGHFRLVMPQGFSGSVEVVVSELSGKQILTRNCNENSDFDFDLSALSKGTYHVMITTPTGKTAKKLIIL